MGLDIWFKEVVTEYRTVFDGNITSNLGEMARQADIYDILWRPGESGVGKASQLIPKLEEGLAKLKADPVFFKQFDASNGWGVYDDFVPFVEKVLNACREHPDADVHVWI